MMLIVNSQSVFIKIVDTNQSLTNGNENVVSMDTCKHYKLML